MNEIFDIDEKEKELWQQEEKCSICAMPDTMKPSHNGSKNCKSGSIASGGKRAHCTCDICF